MTINNRRKFRRQTSDNMDTWKSRRWKSQSREEQKREDQRRERVRGKKVQVRQKVGKSEFSGFSHGLWLRGSKARLAKEADAEPAGQMRDELLHAIVGEAQCQVKMHETHQDRTAFGS